LIVEVPTRCVGSLNAVSVSGEGDLWVHGGTRCLSASGIAFSTFFSISTWLPAPRSGIDPDYFLDDAVEVLTKDLLDHLRQGHPYTHNPFG
jgi:hypothetical protein